MASGALLAAPLARAQAPGKVWRIGVLSPDQADTPAGKFLKEVFPQVLLRRYGYSEGRNLRIEWRWSDNRSWTLKALAEDLVRQNVDLIVARTSSPILAAMDATRTIPIVMLNGNFPVENGLVQSLARPGGNVTGTAYASSETYAKLLQLLKEIAPKAIRLTSLQARPDDPRLLKVWTAMVEGIQRAAERLGMSSQDFEVGGGSLEEVMRALEGMAKSRSDFMLYWIDPSYRAHEAAIADFLLRHRIPSISIGSGYVENGGLAQYVADFIDTLRRTASFVDRILKGARPAELPVELPTKYEFAVNLKTAKSIGITIPQSVLARADRVIE